MSRVRVVLVACLLNVMAPSLSSAPALGYVPPVSGSVGWRAPQVVGARRPRAAPAPQLRAWRGVASGARAPACRTMHGTASARARSGAARVEAGASAGEAGADVRVGSDGTRPGFTVVEVLALPHTLPGEQQVRMAGEQLLREVTPEGMSLALGLHLCFPEQYKSMSAARKALRRGEILSETMAELSTSVRVRGGEALLVQRRSQPGLYPQGEKPFDLDVLFEDDHMAVVVKPPGVMTHRHRLSGQSGTVKSGLAYVLAPTRADDALFRPAPCHRLDQGTGGLLVAAKTRRAVAAISAQFAERRVSKEYAAVVAGRLEGEHTVAAPLSGVAAETHVAGRGGVRSLKYGWVSEVACRPVTGRKHQIRRHLLSLGHPIVGDARYTGASCGRPEWTPDDCGLLLWATRLELDHPLDQRRLVFESPPSERFARFLRREGERYRKFHPNGSKFHPGEPGE